MILSPYKLVYFLVTIFVPLQNDLSLCKKLLFPYKVILFFAKNFCSLTTRREPEQNLFVPLQKKIVLL